MRLFLDFLVPELNTYTAEVLETVLPGLPNSLAWCGITAVLLVS